MEILFCAVFLLLCAAIYFLFAYWWLLLIIVGIVGTVTLIVWLAYLKSLDRIILAKIVARNPKVKTISEKTGHTTSYGRYLSYHEHYRDRNVITGYDVTFWVKYENGREAHITCEEKGIVYNRLFKK
jgi:ABC-type lipoprotein release transport system permease subunit